MRTKEEANDYRYFPDPDLLPVEFDDAFIAAIAAELPELPDAKRHRFTEQYGLSEQDASALSASRELADYFEQAATEAGDAKLAANWIMGDLSAALNRDNKEIGDSVVTASMLGGLVQRIKDNTISGKIAKQVFEAMWEGEGTADQVIEAKGLKQITDSGAIEVIVDQVIAANPEQVENYRGADEAKRGKMIGFFVGQVMKASQGKANPQQVNQLLKQKLS
jgi:aspartyl-tRNA(Asn)/glutamyl-tRNA(Gln) amidotransferase subunit B